MALFLGSPAARQMHAALLALRPTLLVRALAPQQLLAMKLSAWRDDVDVAIADARVLLRLDAEHPGGAQAALSRPLGRPGATPESCVRARRPGAVAPPWPSGTSGFSHHRVARDPRSRRFRSGTRPSESQRAASAVQSSSSPSGEPPVLPAGGAAPAAGLAAPLPSSPQKRAKAVSSRSSSSASESGVRRVRGEGGEGGLAQPAARGSEPAWRGGGRPMSSCRRACPCAPPEA